MTDGVSVVGKNIEIMYQAGYDDEGMIAEPAIIIKRYEQDNDVFGIIQGDQEIIVGGLRSMKQLAKAIKGWSENKGEKMNKFILTVILLFSTSIYSQNAKVIALSPEDAKTVEDVEKQVDAAMKRRNDVHEFIRLKYVGGAPANTIGIFCLNVSGCVSDKKTWKETKPGWESGFEFSEDWKYIVPLKFTTWTNNTIPCTYTIPTNFVFTGN